MLCKLKKKHVIANQSADWLAMTCVFYEFIV